MKHPSIKEPQEGQFFLWSKLRLAGLSLVLIVVLFVVALPLVSISYSKTVHPTYTRGNSQGVESASKVQSQRPQQILALTLSAETLPPQQQCQGLYGQAQQQLGLGQQQCQGLYGQAQRQSGLGQQQCQDQQCQTQ